MITIKEIVTIIIIGIILGFVIGFQKSMTFMTFFYFLGIILAVIALNVMAKKIMAYYLESEIEMKIFSLKRFGFKPHDQFQKEIPVGLFAPLVLLGLTLGSIRWLASLVFDVKPKTYRSAKRHGLYSFTEMTEYDIGLIAAAGILTNLAVAFIFYFFGQEEFCRLNIFYAFYNMLPLSDLDGNKILFGSIILWSFIAALTLIGLGYAILMP
jgi:hypothetical protein